MVLSPGQTLVKRGGAEVGGRMGERRRGGCVMAVVTLRFSICSGLIHPEITKLYTFSFFQVKSPGVSMR